VQARAGSLFWNKDYKEYTFAVALLGVYCIWEALKLWIDERHIDYLLHKWDLESAIARFRVEQMERESERRNELLREPTESELKRRGTFARKLEDDLGV
jgi:hypothetical protein